MRTRRVGVVIGLGAMVCLLQTGCTIWLSKELVREEWQDRVVLAERVTGPPVARLVRHADGLGWTVEVREPIEQTVARKGTRAWKGHTALIAPGLSHLYMAIMCTGITMALGLSIPFGWVTTIDWAGAGPTFRDVCAYPLVGLVPRLEPPDKTGRAKPFVLSRAISEDTEVVTEDAARETGWRAVGGALAGVRMPEQAWLRYPAEADGQVRMRLERVPIAVVPTAAVEVEVGAWARGKEIDRWREIVEPEAWRRLTQDSMGATARWPARMDLGVLAWEGWPAVERERWERRLLDDVTRVVGERGGRVIPLMPEHRAAIERERERQFSGRVDDQWQVSLGRDAGATVLLRPVLRRREALALIGADLLVTETGEAVMSVAWEVPWEAREGAAEAVIARVVRVLAQGTRGRGRDRERLEWYR
jgi:hypothetical protein